MAEGVLRGICLDWIVMKCLNKDRTRRYATASNLAGDVERYLKDEPVEACPPSVGYRLRKFTRRYRAALAAAAVFVALLGLGVLVSTWQAVRATVAERSVVAASDAEAAARRQAEQQTEIANQQTAIASQRVEALAWEDYINRVNRAYREVQDNNIALAEDLLHGCPSERRGWEWHYVNRLCHPERLAVEVPARSVSAIAFSPDGRRIVSGGLDRSARVWDATPLPAAILHAQQSRYQQPLVVHGLPPETRTRLHNGQVSTLPPGV